MVLSNKGSSGVGPAEDLNLSNSHKRMNSSIEKVQETPSKLQKPKNSPRRKSAPVNDSMTQRIGSSKSPAGDQKSSSTKAWSRMNVTSQASLDDSTRRKAGSSKQKKRSSAGAGHATPSKSSSIQDADSTSGTVQDLSMPDVELANDARNSAAQPLNTPQIDSTEDSKRHNLSQNSQAQGRNQNKLSSLPSPDLTPDLFEGGSSKASRTTSYPISPVSSNSKSPHKARPTNPKWSRTREARENDPTKAVPYRIRDAEEFLRKPSARRRLTGWAPKFFPQEHEGLQVLGGSFVHAAPLFLNNFEALAASCGEQVQTFSLNTSERVLRMPSPRTAESNRASQHGDHPTCLRVDPRNDGVLLTAAHGAVKRWNLDDGSFLGDDWPENPRLTGNVVFFDFNASGECDFTVQENRGTYRVTFGEWMARVGKRRVKQAVHAGEHTFWFCEGDHFISSLKADGRFNRIPSREEVFCIALSPSRSKFAVADINGMITIWSGNPNERGTPFTRHHWHSSAVTAMRFSDDNELVSGGREGVVVIWDLSSNAKRFITGIPGTILHLQLDEQGCNLAVTVASNAIRVYNIQTNALILDRKGIQVDKTAPRIAFSRRIRDGLLALPDEQGGLRLYDPSEDSVVCMMDCVPTRRVQGYARPKMLMTNFSVDGTWLVTACQSSDDEYFTSRIVVGFWNDMGNGSFKLKSTVTTNEAPVACVPTYDGGFVEVGLNESRYWKKREDKKGPTWAFGITVIHPLSLGKAMSAVCSLQDPLVVIGFERGIGLFDGRGNLIQAISMFSGLGGVTSLFIHSKEAMLRVVTGTGDVKYFAFRTLRFSYDESLLNITWSDGIAMLNEGSNGQRSVMYTLRGVPVNIGTLPSKIFLAQPQGSDSTEWDSMDDRPPLLLYYADADLFRLVPANSFKKSIKRDTEPEEMDTNSAADKESLPEGENIYPISRSDFTDTFGKAPELQVVDAAEMDVNQTHVNFTQWKNAPVLNVSSISDMLEDSLRFSRSKT